MNLLLKIFNEVLFLGASSTVLIVLILVVKKLFRKVLSPKWHYCIWILLIIRLLIPFSPESSISALSLIYMAADQLSLPVNEISAPVVNNGNNINSSDTATSMPPVIDENTSNSGNTVSNTSDVAEVSEHNNQSKQVSFMLILAYIWITGMLLITVYTIYLNVCFTIKVRRNYKRLNNPVVYEILNDCKRIMRIDRSISIFTTKSPRTPSLYSLYHTKILISEAHLERLSEQELKYIFLHELSHYKRKDIAINWILTLLQIVYFFNPFIWFAFYKIHEDCEISCDAQALKYLREDEYQGYGSTVIKLIRLNSESNFIPATAGLWKHKSNYRRRIIMITKYKKSKWPSTLLTLILILLIGLIGLTGCKKLVDTSSNNDASDISDVNEDTENNEVTSEPTPEITNSPVTSTTNDLSNITQLAGLLGLSKDALIDQLGEDYNEVDESGLEFTNPGIRVWFNANSITNQIFTDRTDIDFNGVIIGDTLDSFKNALGEPVSDINSDAFFKSDEYYLSVYYDNSTGKTYAIYILSEDAAAAAMGSDASASAPTPNDTASADESESSAASQATEAFYGDWVINKVIAYGSVGTYSKEDAESLIGRRMSYSKDSASCFGDQPANLDVTAKNPTYEITEITNSDFVVNYHMTLETLGITADSVAEVTASDTQGNGSTFLIKDDNTLIVIGGGTYFELVRSTN